MSDITLLPGIATKRAYAGAKWLSCRGAGKVSLITFRTRLPKDASGERSYRGSSPQMAPKLAQRYFLWRCRSDVFRSVSRNHPGMDHIRYSLRRFVAVLS